MRTEDITPEWLHTQFVELGKTSRQISREFSVSRKIINKQLLTLGLVKRSELLDSDLP